MSKRENGTGSIWKDKDDQWWASLRFRKGERPYKVRASSEKDAEEKLRDLQKRKEAALATLSIALSAANDRILITNNRSRCKDKKKKTSS